MSLKNTRVLGSEDFLWSFRWNLQPVRDDAEVLSLQLGTLHLMMHAAQEICQTTVEKDRAWHWLRVSPTPVWAKAGQVSTWNVFGERSYAMAMGGQSKILWLMCAWRCPCRSFFLLLGFSSLRWLQASTMDKVVVSKIFYFHRYLGKIPSLTNGFKGVETTNQWTFTQVAEFFLPRSTDNYCHQGWTLKSFLREVSESIGRLINLSK